VTFAAPSTPGHLITRLTYKGAPLLKYPVLTLVTANKAPLATEKGYKPFGLAYIGTTLYATELENKTKGRLVEFKQGKEKKVLKSDFVGPRGLSATPKGELLIPEETKVSLMSLDLKVIASFGDVTNPRLAIPLPGDQYLICDTDFCRLKILDKDKVATKTVGFKTAGKAPLQFHFPLSAAVNPLNPNEVAVADLKNGRVQFISLSPVDYLGELGKEEDLGVGQIRVDFTEPNSVFYDVNGYLYVTDLETHQLHIFSTTREHLRVIGGKGNGPEQFNSPRTVVISPEGDICVADNENCRIMFL